MNLNFRQQTALLDFHFITSLHTRAMQCSRNLDNTYFEDTVITGDMHRPLDMMGANFSLLVSYIHAEGYVKTAAKSYLPHHPVVRTVNPNYVRIGNLRAYVEALAGETEF